MCKIYTVSELNNKLFIRLTGKWLEEKGFNKGFIRLTGKWLEEKGFNKGDKFRLFYDNGILVLIKVDKEDTNKDLKK